MQTTFKIDAIDATDGNTKAIDEKIRFRRATNENTKSHFKQGFVIDGGYIASSAGDVNGDGLDDLFVNTWLVSPAGSDNKFTSTSFVVFGKVNGAAVDLSNIASNKGGFSIGGNKIGDTNGYSISSAGDVNGDGLDDLIVGIYAEGSTGKENSGKSFVVFGKVDGAAVDLSNIDPASGVGTGGFVINGEKIGDLSGYSVSSAGDVNGDGLDDLIIGGMMTSEPKDHQLSKIFVAFGKKNSTSAIDLSVIDKGVGGFTIIGANSNEFSGWTVSSAGDVNGDGFDDLIIGSRYAIFLGKVNSGKSYVVFGKANGTTVNLSDIASASGTGTGGFVVNGEKEGDYSGCSVSSAGDVNGDGLNDVIIGALYADSVGGVNAGKSYVVFGKMNTTAIDLSDMASRDSTDGFIINGAKFSNLSGWSVSSAGDVNGDGLSDLIVGAHAANPFARTYAGKAYVVFGKRSSAPINLSDIELGIGGFVINGDKSCDYSGDSVSSAGDVNGDGLDDLIIGASGAGPAKLRDAGKSYVIFGKTDTAAINLTDFNNGVDGVDGIAHAIDFKGNDSDEKFTGSSKDELFVAGRGNDTLTGNGGADVFNAGAGDDTIIINADNLAKLSRNTLSSHLLASINGGSGHDTLKLVGYNLTLDLSKISDGRIQGIETIVLSGPKMEKDLFNTLSCDLYDVLNLSNETNILKIRGPSSIIKAIGFHKSNTVESADGVTYVVYFHENAPTAKLWIEQGANFRVMLDVSVTVFVKDGTTIVLELTFDRKVDGLQTGFMNRKIFKMDGAKVFSFWSGEDDTNIRTLSYTMKLGENGEVSIDKEALRDRLDTTLYERFSRIDIADIVIPVAKGFVVNGEKADYETGISVSSAGDVNGDGLNDLIIGSPANMLKSLKGKTYVVFGRTNGTPINLSDIDAQFGVGGFVINGENNGDGNGRSISSAGDVNGDGFDDLIIGSWLAKSGKKEYSGKTYVVYGKGDTKAINLADVASPYDTGGFVINGEDSHDYSGNAVSSAGDVNGDGFADLIISAQGSKVAAGKAFVVFGGDRIFTATDLSDIGNEIGTDGFTISGVSVVDGGTITSVSSAGDVNGDGLDDLIVGTPSASTVNGEQVGKSYVVFGKKSNTTINLLDVALSSNIGTGGFVINGETSNDYSGHSVSSAGDVNGDGLDDLIIGAPNIEQNGATGRAYVVFGKKSGAAINLSDISAATSASAAGFVINGKNNNDNSGISVSSAGDVNGDGLDDLIVGANKANPDGRPNAGKTFVVFGKTSGTAVNLSDISLASGIGTGGFVINGEHAGDNSGISVSSAGDINGDGLDDLIVGANKASTAQGKGVGKSYVIFGKKDTTAVDLADVAQYGISTHVIDFQEKGAGNTFVGSANDELFVTGVNNDVLVGNGGNDVFYAGNGDDRITINADNLNKLSSDTLSSNLLTSINGGGGRDTLHLAGEGLHLDLRAIDDNRIQGIEVINLSGGDGKLGNKLTFTLRDFFSLSDEINILLVQGSHLDSVNAIGFSQSSSEVQTVSDHTYNIHHYSAGSSEMLNSSDIELWIQQGVQML